MLVVDDIYPKVYVCPGYPRDTQVLLSPSYLIEHRGARPIALDGRKVDSKSRYPTEYPYNCEAYLIAQGFSVSQDYRPYKPERQVCF